MDFLLFLIRVSIPLISFGLIIFAISPKLVLLIGYAKPGYDEYVAQKDDLLSSSQSYERISAKVFFAMIDNRLIVGGVGCIGLVLSLLSVPGVADVK